MADTPKSGAKTVSAPCKILDDLRAAEAAAIFLVKSYLFIRRKLLWPNKHKACTSPEARGFVADWVRKFSERVDDETAKVERVQTEIRDTKDGPFRFDQCASTQNNFATAHEAAILLGAMIITFVQFGAFSGMRKLLGKTPDSFINDRIAALDREIIIDGFDGIQEAFEIGFWPKAKEIESVIKIETAKALVTYRRPSTALGQSEETQSTRPASENDAAFETSPAVEEAAKPQLPSSSTIQSAAADLNQPRSSPLKEPTKNMMTVYRYWLVTGKTQIEMATDPFLMEQLKTTVGQGTISRWMQQVKKWLEAGNVLPHVSEGMRETPTAMDPKQMDLGKRKDSRTERQRERHKSDDRD